VRAQTGGRILLSSSRSSARPREYAASVMLVRAREEPSKSEWHRCGGDGFRSRPSLRPAGLRPCRPNCAPLPPSPLGLWPGWVRLLPSLAPVSAPSCPCLASGRALVGGCCPPFSVSLPRSCPLSPSPTGRQVDKSGPWPQNCRLRRRAVRSAWWWAMWIVSMAILPGCGLAQQSTPVLHFRGSL
jgi:hypothetical protein